MQLLKSENKNLKNNLTEGPITKKLILFSIPLLIGNLLQQVYFIADSVIVGNYIGSEALAAVGNASSITMLMIQFFMGISSGTGILLAQFAGAKNLEKLNHTVRAAMLFNVAFGIALSIAGILMTDVILTAMETPEDVFVQTRLYLIVSFAGMLPMLIYNMGASSMQALGDSKTPLYFLCLASILNILLDLFFVIKLGTGVEGTAVATCIAQLVAAVLVYSRLKKYIRNIIRFENAETQATQVTEIKSRATTLDWSLMKRIMVLGLPIGIQSVVISLSNIVVQSHINSLGSSVMAAWSAFCRVDSFILLPITSFFLAVMTFTGQNYGAKNPKRIFKGLKSAVLMCVICTVTAGGIILILAEPCFAMFTDESAVINIACQMAWHMVPFYFMLAIQRCLVGTISGIGDSFMPMVINFAFMCVFRLISIPGLTSVIGRNMDVLYYTYWSSWVLSFVSVSLYYFVKTKKHIEKLEQSC